MKVLFLTAQFPFPHQLERCAYSGYIAQALAASIEVDVLAPQPWVPPLPRSVLRDSWLAMKGLPDVGLVHGVRVSYPRYISIPRVTRPLLGRFFEGIIRRHVEAAARDRPYDLIHASWLYPEGVSAVKYAASVGVPVVVTALGTDANVLAHQGAIGLEIHSAMSRATVLTGVSRPLCASLSAMGGPSVPVVHTPNGIDTSVFSLSATSRAAARASLGIPPEAPHAVFVGRLEPVKQVELLVNAWGASRASRLPGARLTIIGEGSERSALQLLANRQDPRVRIEFAGRKSQHEVAQWLSAATVGCLSSRSEGMPNIVLEALACGTPVVATAVGGVPDLIDDTCGVLCTPGDIASFAAGLDEAIDRTWDPARVALRGGRPWAAAASTYLDAYKLALERAPQRKQG